MTLSAYLIEHTGNYTFAPGAEGLANFGHEIAPMFVCRRALSPIFSERIYNRMP
jgi:hypothetical protein